jgi:hypothetical protein
MKEKINRKGFIQISILIAIIVGVLVVGGGGYFGYTQFKNYQIKQAEKEKQAQELKQNEQNLEIDKLKKEMEGLKKSQQESTQQQKSANSSAGTINNITSADLQLYLDGITLIECNDSKGSGSFWKINEQYFVLTNYHVVATPYSDGRCDAMLLDRTTGSLKGAYAVYPGSSKRWNSYADVALLELFRSTSWDSVMSSPSAPISSLDFKISSLSNCSSKMPIGSSIVVIGYPAFGVKQWTSQIGGENLSGEQSTLIVSDGVISGYDSTVAKPIGNLPYPNYFVSAKIDSGNSGGIALSKTGNNLCVLGIPTWLNLGNFETQGLIQNISNVFYQE